MPSPVVLVLVLAVLATVGAVVWTVRVLLRELARLGRDVDQLQVDVAAALDAVERDLEVTRTEADAVLGRVDQLTAARRARSRRRWRPPTRS